jgi:hypothetical protein
MSISTISGQPFAKYPITLTNAFVTRTLRFLNDKEQRWTVRNSLFSARIQYRGLNGFDAALLRSFFQMLMGKYVDPALTNTFSIVVNGNTYNYCVFDQDQINFTAERGETFSTEIMIRQLRQN